MVDPKLLTIFLALTALAVLIQTGILVGFYFVSTKLSRQADQALDFTRGLLGPLEKAVENLRVVTFNVAELSSSAQRQLRHFERWLKRDAA